MTETTEAIHQTKRDILNAAERLFAAHGFRATSLRAITTEAQVNLAAVNYHFASKDALIVAVLRRRIKPINDQRLELLDRHERAAAGKPLPLETILDVLFRPPLEFMTGGTKGGRYFARLISQCLAEPSPFLHLIVVEEFAEKNRRFHTAIRRALPYLSSEEVHWRLHFAHGVFHHTVANAHVVELSSGGKCRLDNVERVLRRMIAFCAAGLRTNKGEKGS